MQSENMIVGQTKSLQANEPTSMKGLWKNVKQSTTIAVGKMTGSRKDEEPDYIEKSDAINQIESQTVDLIRGMSQWVSALGTTYAKHVALAQAFATSYTEADGQAYRDANSSREAVVRLGDCATNLEQTHIPNFALARLQQLRDEIDALKKVKSSRKDNRILMQSEEGNLKAAQEKNKDVPHRQDRYNEQKALYEKFHNDFMTGAQSIINKKTEVFVRVFQVWQFYCVDFLDRETGTIGEFRQSIPYSSLKQELPGVATKVEVQQVTINYDPVSTSPE
jgi:hypothetical protein